MEKKDFIVQNGELSMQHHRFDELLYDNPLH